MASVSAPSLDSAYTRACCTHSIRHCACHILCRRVPAPGCRTRVFACACLHRTLDSSKQTSRTMCPNCRLSPATSRTPRPLALGRTCRRGLRSTLVLVPQLVCSCRTLCAACMFRRRQTSHLRSGTRTLAAVPSDRALASKCREQSRRHACHRGKDAVSVQGLALERALVVVLGLGWAPV